MERIVIINESTFTKWMERVKELLSVLHLQEQQMKNKSLGTWLDTSEVCTMLNLSKRSLQSMRERGDEYLFCYGMQWHKCFHVCLLATLADEPFARVFALLI